MKRPLFIDITRPLVRSLRARLPTGVDRVNLEYIRHFGDEALAVVTFRHHAVILSKSASQKLFQILTAPSSIHRALPIRLAARAAAAVLASALGRSPVHRQPHGATLLNTGHRGLEHASYASNLRKRGIRPVFLIHDLIPITHPEYCRDGEAARHRRRIRHAATMGAGIIVNSRSTLNDWHRHLQQHDLPSPPAVVAPLGLSLAAQSAEQALIPTPYFVMLGTIEPRKNHLLVLHAWRRLVEQFGAAAPKLVLIGQRGWECEQVEDLLDRCTELRSAVIERPRCNDQELHAYLRHARGLLFPSFAEGFGLPLVEALAHGVPVIASNLDVFREVAGDIPHYIDPTDGPALYAAIVDYAQSSSPQRQAQLERIRHFDAPSWRRHFEQAGQFLASLG